MNIRDFKSWCWEHRKILSTVCTILPLIIGLYFERDNIRSLGLPLTVNDVIQAIGQFGTVGAFWVGFKQLKKSKEDAKEAKEKERISSLATAATMQIGKMAAEVRLLDRHNPTPDDTCEFINKMNSFAGNFERFFRQIPDGDQKDFVLSDWQDMYFNDLLPKLYSMNIMSLVASGVSQALRVHAAQYADMMQQRHQYTEPFKKYRQAINILDSLDSAIPRPLQEQYEEEASSFYLFKEYFFADSHVEELLVGTANIVEFEIQAPALAAVFRRFGQMYHL